MPPGSFAPDRSVRSSESVSPEIVPGFFCALRGLGYTGSWRKVSKEREVRVNREIRISPIRLIGPEGAQLGVVAIEEARRLAEQADLDLVEVAPEARPPVVKIMDYGKFRYEEQRAARAARKKQHTVQVKEVKFRPGVEKHDYDFKLRHARRFLEEGNRVRLTMMFRGRQVTLPEVGRKVLDRATEDLSDVSLVELKPSFEGRTMFMVLAPRTEPNRLQGKGS